MATTVAVTDLPMKVLPMDAEKTETVAACVGKHESVLEPKYDGWRILWKIDEDGKARAFTRTGNELTGSMPALEAALSAALPPGTILDSEAVVFETVDGRVIHRCGQVAKILGCSVAKAALRSGALSLVVFDMLAHAGIDARPLPRSQRLALLEKMFEVASFPSNVALVPQMEATDENYDKLIGAGYEGGMVKWLDAPYKSGVRGHGQFKVKGTATVDVIITGYKDGNGSFEGLVGAVEFGQYDDNGLLVHRGRCSGMDFDVRTDISKHRDEYLGRVFEMTHNGVQKPENGNLARFRHPRFIRFRPDKPADKVVIDNG